MSITKSDFILQVTVVRGKTYTFVIEGGEDEGSPAAYHPLYITDDSEGGYQFKTEEQRRKVKRGKNLKKKKIFQYLLMHQVPITY